MWHGRRVQTRGDQARNVRDVRHHLRADAASDLAYSRKIYRPRISRRSADQEFWSVLFGDLLQLIVIDLLRLAIDPIVGNLVIDARKIERMTVRQMTAV